MKLFINCINLSVGNRIKTFGSSGWCEYCNVPMWQTVGLWHTSPRPSLTCSLESYSLTENKSLLRSLFDMVATYFEFANVSDRLWGWTRFYERAERASNGHNFQAIHIPYIALHIFRVITYFCQPFRTSHCTVRCGNSTAYVKLSINCIHLSVGNRIKTSRSSGWCEYLNVPMCQTVGLWHTSPRPSLDVRARKL